MGLFSKGPSGTQNRRHLSREIKGQYPEAKGDWKRHIEGLGVRSLGQRRGVQDLCDFSLARFSVRTKGEELPKRITEWLWQVFRITKMSYVCYYDLWTNRSKRG